MFIRTLFANYYLLFIHPSSVVTNLFSVPLGFEVQVANSNFKSWRLLVYSYLVSSALFQITHPDIAPILPQSYFENMNSKHFLPTFFLFRNLSADARVPSIKFLGKRIHGSPQVLTPIKSLPIVSIDPVAKAKTNIVTTAVDHSTLKGGAWFGRPILTSAEILAIESGGATVLL